MPLFRRSKIRLMQRVILLLYCVHAFVYLSSCRVNKNISSEASSVNDSVCTMAEYRSSASLDSLLVLRQLSFDSLSIDIERPSEQIRLRAFGVSVSERKKMHRAAVVGYNRLDSVAYKSASSESLSDRSITTGVYSPPSGFVVAGLVLSLVALGFVYIKIQD